MFVKWYLKDININILLNLGFERVTLDTLIYEYININLREEKYTANMVIDFHGSDKNMATQISVLKTLDMYCIIKSLNYIDELAG